MTCKKHPVYTGKGYPTPGCPKCMDVYIYVQNKLRLAKKRTNQ